MKANLVQCGGLAFELRSYLPQRGANKSFAAECTIFKFKANSNESCLSCAWRRQAGR